MAFLAGFAGGFGTALDRYISWDYGKSAPTYRGAGNL